MAVILSIETSTSVCSAALHENGELIKVKVLHTPQSAASQLSVLIDQLFATTGITRNQLNSIAVSSGPGSYTGLRIGIATAKGICFGLNVPLIAIDSLRVLASSLPSPSTDFLCPMIDARRMEVYSCLLDPLLNFKDAIQARIIDEQSYADVLAAHSILFFGDGAAKCQPVITSPNAYFLENIYPSAAHMGKLAMERFVSNQWENLNSFEPNYLKEFKVKTKMV